MQDLLSSEGLLLSAPGGGGLSLGQGFLPCAGRLALVPGRDKLSGSVDAVLGQGLCNEAPTTISSDAGNSVLVRGTQRTDALPEETLKLCSEGDKQWSDEDSFS